VVICASINNKIIFLLAKPPLYYLHAYHKFIYHVFSVTGENLHHGTPANPVSSSLVPGGSCSGSAVAVSAQLVDFAIGISERFLPSTDYKPLLVHVNGTFFIMFLLHHEDNAVCM
jgi:hypothetical protein